MAAGYLVSVKGQALVLLQRLICNNKLGLQLDKQNHIPKVAVFPDYLDAVNNLMTLHDLILENRDFIFDSWDVQLHYTSRNNSLLILWANKQGHKFPEQVFITKKIPQDFQLLLEPEPQAETVMDARITRTAVHFCLAILV